LLGVFVFGTLQAQNQYSQDQDFQDILETILEDSEDEDFDFDTFLELLENYNDTPLDLNKANKDDLLELRLISEKQVNALLEHRERVGDLLNIYELQAIDFFDLETIQLLLPFVEVRGEIGDFYLPFKDLLFSGKKQVFIRHQTILENQHGYTIPDTSDQSRYLGNKHKVYARFRYNYGTRLSYGLTMEKDAGEQFFKGAQKAGFDYYSSHFYWADHGALKALVVGDYEIKLGQGLIMWSGFGFGKSVYVAQVKKGGKQVKPYTSVNEAKFLRGAAVSLEFKNLTLTTFGSYKGLDANISEIDTIQEEVTSISSFQESGFHRTESEIEDKNAIKEAVAGANITYGKRHYHIGVTGTFAKYSASIEKDLSPYNQFDFTSDQLTNFGIDYQYLWRNLNFFGETAGSGNGGMATINGLIASLHPKVDLSVVQRYFGRDYHSRFANVFSESSKIRPNNERGVFVGISLKPIRYWKFEGYFDIYQHPWLKFQADAPSKGTDYMFQAVFKPSKKFEMYGRVRSETKSRNAVDNQTSLDFLVDTRKTSVRFDLRYKLTKAITLKSRVELSYYDDGINETQKGFMVYQDFNFKSLNFPLSVSTRFAIFDTDDWDTRIYAYENEVLYQFSVPPYYGRGTRFYVVFKYHVWRNIDVWFRFAQTYFADQETIGAGLTEIDGNIKSEIKTQVRFKF
jgi:hypothetical protein